MTAIECDAADYCSALRKKRQRVVVGLVPDDLFCGYLTHRESATNPQGIAEMASNSVQVSAEPLDQETVDLSNESPFDDERSRRVSGTFPKASTSAQ